MKRTQPLVSPPPVDGAKAPKPRLVVRLSRWLGLDESRRLAPGACCAHHQPQAPAAALQRVALTESTPSSQAASDEVLDSLRRILDQHPKTRSVMRHLTAVEQAIAERGLGALSAASREDAARALEQLDIATKFDLDVPLAALRAALALRAAPR